MIDYVQYSLETMFPFLINCDLINTKYGTGNNELPLDQVLSWFKDKSNIHVDNSVIENEAMLKKKTDHVQKYIDFIKNRALNQPLDKIVNYEPVTTANGRSYRVPLEYVTFFNEVCRNTYWFLTSMNKCVGDSCAPPDINQVTSSDYTLNFNKLTEYIYDNPIVVSSSSFSVFLSNAFKVWKQGISTLNGSLKNSHKEADLFFLSHIPYMHLCYNSQRIPFNNKLSSDITENNSLENRYEAVGNIYKNVLYTVYSLLELCVLYVPYSPDKIFLENFYNSFLIQVGSHINDINSEIVSNNKQYLKTLVKSSQEKSNAIYARNRENDMLASKVANYLTVRRDYAKKANVQSVLYWILFGFLIAYLLVNAVFGFLKMQSINIYMIMVNIGVIITCLIGLLVSIII
jgi:hypothetical protein